MTRQYPIKPNVEDVQRTIDHCIERMADELYLLNRKIYDEPEVAFKEFKAQQNISEFLEGKGHQVQRGTYDVPTCFEARYGTGGRCVNFNAEYDALPQIGHACGHNLIAVAGISAYLALSAAMQKYGVQGRVQLLGTPAEEDGGGKILLLEAGAYRNVDVSLMVHPTAEEEFQSSGTLGSSGQSSIAILDLIAEFGGSSAHAAGNPWDGINALDALVASYNNVSMLRQQIRPHERIHGCILQAPEITNAIPEYTKLKFSIRSGNMDTLNKLGRRVRACIEAGGTATGCDVVISEDKAYADLWVNGPLSLLFEKWMDSAGVPVSKHNEDETMGGSTDMGNVSQVMPGLHAMIGIPAPPGAFPHSRPFATAAGTLKAHRRILDAAKAMAMTAWTVLVDDETFYQIQSDFKKRKLAVRVC